MTWTFLALALAAAADVPAPPALPTKPRLICRESEQLTGSHMRTGRRCMTEEQWRIEDEARVRIPPSMRITEGQGDALTKQRPQ